MTIHDVSAVISTIFFGCFASVAVLARIWARRSRGVRLGADDWAIVLTLILTWGFGALTIWATIDAGLGLSLQQMTPSSYTNFLKNNYIGTIVEAAAIGTIKISVLLFYKRTFIYQTFNRIANVLIFVCVCWTIIFMCIFAFHILPIRDEWGTEDHYPGSVNLPATFLAGQALDLALDVVILSMPVPMIKSLNLSARRKLLVMSIFGLGAFCIVASIVRLVYLSKFVSLAKSTGGLDIESTFNKTVRNVIIWSMIEPSVSIVAACLPALGPLFGSKGGVQTLMNAISTLFFALTSQSRTSDVLTRDQPQRSDSDDSGKAPVMATVESRKWRHMWNAMNKDGTTLTTVELSSVHEITSTAEPNGSTHAGIRVEHGFGTQI